MCVHIMAAVGADLQLVVCQRGRPANSSVHAHAHLCFVNLLGALNLLLFADGKGVGVQIIYDSEDWIGNEATKQPACQQRRHQQYGCSTPGDTSSSPHICRDTHRQTDGQTDKRMDRWTDRKTHR